MRIVVVDASAALSWLLPAQATEQADAFFTDEEPRVLVAPFVFDWEVQNVLLSALRSGRVSRGGLEALRDQLSGLHIHVSEPFAAALVGDVAEEQGLSLFDAAYFSMATDLDAALASRDTALLDACRACGVVTFDFRAS